MRSKSQPVPVRELASQRHIVCDNQSRAVGSVAVKVIWSAKPVLQTAGVSFTVQC